MADYFEIATVQPDDLCADWFEPQELEALMEAGFERQETKGRYYFYAPVRVCLLDDKEDYLTIFQNVIRRAHGELTEIVIEGATICTKYRPGAFGGFVVRITAEKVQTGNTNDLIELMRTGPWENSER